MRAFLLYFCLNITYGWIPPETFDSGFYKVEDEVISNIELSSKGNITFDDSILSIYDDRLNKVSPEFHIPEYFKHNVMFWLLIYSKYTNEQVVLHDKNNLQLVYKVLDFKNIFNSKINRFAKSKLKRKLTLENKRQLRQIFKRLQTKSFKFLSSAELEIVTNIRKSGLKIPKNKNNRVSFFKKLSKSLRSQSGQRDMILNGIITSLDYINFMENKAALFKLPKEVLTIPFLESSFNLQARSKANAFGVWQFMDYTNNLVMPKVSNSIDYRRNPYISTLAALYLLKENKYNLKSWDLAISAYNAGTKHLLKAKRKLRRKKNIDLAYILENYQHPSLGFAVKNFYSEFLALSHTLAYKTTVFPIEGLSKTKNLKNIDIYIAKCKLKPKTFFSKIKSSAYKIENLNKHFKKINIFYPRGTILLSDIQLTSKKYYKVSSKDILKFTPKKYHLLIKNKKCNS